MKSLLVILSFSLLTNLSFAQSPLCISKGQASDLAATKFLNEYFGRDNSSVFDQTFSFYFYNLSFNENLQGVKGAFFSEEYSFDGLNHVFTSSHTFTSDDTNHMEFSEFEVVVSCLRNNKITADSRTDVFEEY